MTPAIDELGAEDIWKEPVDRIMTRLSTSAAGLATVEVQSRLKTFGPNDAAVVKQSPLWVQFLSRFRNPLVIILLVASGLSAATGDVASFAIVVTIVTISMTIDFVQEVRAQNAVEALRRSVAVPLMTEVPAKTAFDAPAGFSAPNGASLTSFSAGYGSPVSSAWLMKRSRLSSSRPSAGTRSPAISSTMSPGTS